MSRLIMDQLAGPGNLPRTCGDEPDRNLVVQLTGTSAPHLRG